MDVASLPPNSLSQCFVRNGVYKDLKHFATFHLSPRHRFKNIENRCFADEYASLRSATDFSPKCISCISKKRAASLCLCSGRKLEFNRSSLFDNSGPVKKYPRHIVRSEMAEAGRSDTGHPISALKVLGQVRGICFYAVTAVAAIFLFPFMLLAHPFVLLFDRYRRKAQHLIAKIWATLAVALFYRIHVQGLENLPPPDTPAVYVSNHQSFLDIFTLLTLGRSFKFISKTEIFLIPIIGWSMYILGTIPLRRMDARSQIDTFKRCMDLIKKGASVFFFPEGTRSKDGKLGAFKKGAFSIAAKTGVPVVPITLVGTGQIMPSGHEAIVNPGSVKMIIHKPIEGTNADVLCNDARSIISRELSNQG